MSETPMFYCYCGYESKDMMDFNTHRHITRKDKEKMHHGEKSWQNEASQKLGPTGNFPQGKLKSDDEGEIKIGVTNDKGKVIIDFGKPVAWIGFDPAQAKEIGRLLNLHAIQAEIEATQ